jgi:hypothetical protein
VERRERGLALIAVLVALGVLLAMTAPFLLSMGHGADASRALVDEMQADWGSASARDALLQAAANGAPAVDPTPNADGRDEYPSGLDLPEEFAGLTEADGGRTVLQGEVEDLSRRIDLNSATPLSLANLLGLAVRVREEVESDATELAVDGPIDAFPPSGFLICQREVIRYEGRDGDRFHGLTRGAFAELGFFPAQAFRDHVIPADSLVLDFRCLLAVTMPFRAEAEPGRLRPYAAVAELARIAEAGFPGFDAVELEVLERFTTVSAFPQRSARFGRSERVFEIFPDELEQPRILQVKSNVGLGAGSVVRIRSLDGELVEYGLVWDTVSRGNRGTYNLPTRQYVALTQPLSLAFEPLQTLIEPLVKVPVNINTAEREVLQALFAHARLAVAGQIRDANHGASNQPLVFRPREAAELATQILVLRGSEPGLEGGLDPGLYQGGGLGEVDLSPRPFDGFEDLARRLVPLLLGGSDSMDRRRLVLGIYDALQIGCPGTLDQGTVPITFSSGPLVGYRASASHRRYSGLEAARLERSGIALALPGEQLYWGGATQEALDEASRLDRLAPFWQTWPINTSAIAPNQVDAVPPLRTNAHLLASLFPDAGFGEPRFPDRSGTEAELRPQPSTAPLEYPGVLSAHESFFNARHPEGRSLVAEGPYRAANSGPRANAATSGAAEARDHSRIRFPMTSAGGVGSRHAVSFWFRLEETGPQVLYDETSIAEAPERNRILLEVRDGMLTFELRDEAGLDPAPGSSAYAPERSAAVWQAPLESLDLVPGTWFHASLSALGNRPGQLSLLIDGVPRGEPRMRTYTVSPLETYQEDRGAASFLDDRNRFVTIRVESTEHFPERGVLRIGLELFEYSSKDDGTFYCRYDDSAGGRRARASMREFAISVPRDDTGDPRQDLLQIVNGDLDAVVPDHPVGSAVELYGYAIPVYPQRPLQIGGARLADSLGAFSIGRAANRSGLRPIAIDIVGRSPILIGDGFDETWSGDLDLADPAVVQGGGLPPPADDLIAAGFPQGGGFALLVQRRLQLTARTADPGQLSQPAEVGGVEVIRFGSRQGTTLRGVQRAVTLPVRFMADQQGFFAPQQPRKFVVEWSDTMVVRDQNAGRNVSLNELPLYMLFVVPISLPVNGAVDDDPTLVNWAQIRMGGGDDADTEWVRYNALVEGQHLVRADQQAFDQLRFRLTQQTALQRLGVTTGGLDPNEVQLLREPWLAPVADGRRRIGYVEQLEVRFPVVHEARQALAFRGDPFTGTTSHAQPANAQVLPVHRFEFDWPGYGLGTSRAGRGDRVALVQGSAREAGQIPAVEWHSVNWCVRHYSWDQVETDTTGGRAPNDIRERRGDWPFQLIAFQDPVRNIFLGEVDGSRSEQNLQDSRFLDRIVKFPSGELPAADVEEGWFGAPLQDDGLPSRGLVDEIAYVARRALPRPLDQQLPEGGNSFFVRPNVALAATGPMVNLRPRQWDDWGDEAFPRQGGLLAIDGEILAYEQYDPQSGEVRIAPGGRGLLGTRVRAHDEGSLVQFLEHVPAAILSGSVSDRDETIPVQSLGGLPRGGGTVLLGAELLHYTWTRADAELGMPRWNDPDDPRRAARGLFRGRFGTTPASASGGTAAIWFPFRYWDRDRARADDPESAFCQVSLADGPVWFDAFGWREDNQETLVDVQCLLRIDERAAFDADPEQTDGLWRLEDGEVAGAPHRLGRHGERFEARFVHVYRPGAFDPLTFRANAWKRAPTVDWFLLTYEGETRVLAERVTAR